MGQKHDVSSDVCVGAIKDPRLFAYMFELNPWVQNQDLRSALLFRGAIIAAWGYVETALIEIAIRSSRMSEYCDLSKTYPYKLDGRIRYLRKVLDGEGPFSEFRNLGHLLLDRFQKSADLRHAMAHGRMRLIWDVEIVDMRPIDGGAVQMRRTRYTMEQLEKLARKATRLSRLMQRGYFLIEEKGFLPPLHSEPQCPT